MMAALLGGPVRHRLTFDRVLWLGGLLLAVLTLRAGWHDLVEVVGFDGLTHDEAISLQAITGHQLDTHRLVVGEVVPMASVQRWGQLDPDRSAADTLAGLAATDFHPPAYFLLARVWLRLGGALGLALDDPRRALDVDVWLARGSGGRLWLAMLALMAEGLRRRDRVGWACVGAAVLFPLNVEVVRESSNIRPYALLILVTVLAWLLLLRLLQRDGRAHRGSTAALAGLLALGLLTHYLFACVAAALLLALLPIRGRRAVAVGAVAVVPSLPWLVTLGDRAGTPPNHLRRTADGLEASIERLDALLRGYFSLDEVFVDGPLEALPPWALPASIGIVVVVLLLRRDRVGRALALALAFPLALPLLVDLIAHKRLLSTDRVAVAFVPLAFWAMAWLAAGLGRRLGPVLVVLAGLWTIPALAPLEPEAANVNVFGGERLHREQRRHPDARILVATTTDSRGQLMQRARYLPADADLVLVEGKGLGGQVVAAAEDHDLVHVLLMRRPRGHPRIGTRRIKGLDRAMGRAGWEQSGRKRWQRNGWVQYRRRAEKEGPKSGRPAKRR